MPSILEESNVVYIVYYYHNYMYNKYYKPYRKAFLKIEDVKTYLHEQNVLLNSYKEEHFEKSKIEIETDLSFNMDVSYGDYRYETETISLIKFEN